MSTAVCCSCMLLILHHHIKVKKILKFQNYYFGDKRTGLPANTVALWSCPAVACPTAQIDELIANSVRIIIWGGKYGGMLINSRLLTCKNRSNRIKSIRKYHPCLKSSLLLSKIDRHGLWEPCGEWHCAYAQRY